jgi:hypothetical protein
MTVELRRSSSSFFQATLQKGNFHMKEHLVRASLDRSVSHLPQSAHDAIVAGLRRDGLVDDESHIHAAAAARIDTLATAAQDRSRAHLARQAVNLLRNNGLHDVDINTVIDGNALSEKMRARGLSVSRRMEIKTALASINVIG